MIRFVVQCIFFDNILFYFIRKQMAYFTIGISLDSKKEYFVTNNVRETDSEVFIQDSFLRIMKSSEIKSKACWPRAILFNFVETSYSCLSSFRDSINTIRK